MDMGIPEGCGALQRARRQLRPCIGEGRRHLQKPRHGKGTHNCLLNPLAPGKKNPLENPHLVHHGKNPIHPLLRCVLLLRKLHCVSLRQQDRTRSHTRLCPAWTVSPGKDTHFAPQHPPHQDRARRHQSHPQQPDPDPAPVTMATTPHQKSPGRESGGVSASSLQPPCPQSQAPAQRGPPGAARPMSVRPPHLPPSDISHPQCPASRSS